MSQKEIQSSISPEERARRRAAVGKAATEKIAKSEQLNFRIEEQAILELQDLAFRKGMPVGTMIRDWVLERLSQEKLGTADLTGKALHVLDELHGKLQSLFGPLETPSGDIQRAGRRASAPERRSVTKSVASKSNRRDLKQKPQRKSSKGSM